MSRLAADAPHGWAGEAIDRGQPLRFRLNGRMLAGYAGDTVLSAALANDIIAAGRHGDSPLALEERFAPLISPTRGKTGLVLPMARTPALNGVDYVTLGERRDPIASTGLLGALRNRVLGPFRTLNHRYGGPPPAPPWHGARAETVLEADLVVIGAGVAGLAAAGAAVAAGKQVVIIEKAASAGGAAGFFGAVDNETPPAALVAQLLAGLEGKGQARLLTNAEAYRVLGGRVFAHRVTVTDGRVSADVVAVQTPRVILATGAFERLPVFPGNRTPGVVGALAAWQRATRHGVWIGNRLLVSTPHSHSYRLALHAADAGIAVQRIVDSRINPHSRFIDFSKAIGVTLASGQIPALAEPIRRNEASLKVTFAVAIEGLVQETEPVETEMLIASGGWQPDLALWLAAGGSARWNDDRQALLAEGRPEGIVLAGAAAGYRSTAAAVASGRAAALGLFGKSASVISDEVIPSEFETPDGSSPSAEIQPGRVISAYLDRGPTLVTRRIAAASRHGISQLAAQASVLSLGDVAAATALGAIAPDDAGMVAAERCVPGVELADSGWRVTVTRPAAPALAVPPPYLAGRFGPRPQLCVIAVSDSRHFEPGCLIFLGSDTRNADDAVGVIFAPAPGGRSGGLALMGQVPERLDATIYVVDSSGAVMARVLERLRG
jgi:sarcosine oxidase, subunit alpha